VLIFGYGSLMGDNALRDCRGQRALLRGYHRSFNHVSNLRWGTSEHPCPIFGLSPGGECWGVAFEVPPQSQRAVMRRLERREGTDERRQTRVKVELPEGPEEAWTWITRPERLDGYSWEDRALLAWALQSAHGIVGTGAEYVRTVVHALELHGLSDPEVQAVWERISA